MKLSLKIPGVLITLLAIAIIAVGAIAVIFAQAALSRSAEGKLVALVDARAAALESYLSTIEEDLGLMAIEAGTAEATAAFTEAYASMGGTTARRLYVDDNPKDALWDLRDAGDGSGYSAVHARFHDWFKTFAERRGYYDVFLISPAGDVVYTYTKEPDFATNLASGPWKESDLARVWRQVADGKRTGAVTFTDFAPYEPSKGVAASFIGTPIMRGSELLGVLVFQMPIGRINAVMQRAEGMGESGETFIVGADFLMRSDSRFLKEGESSILKQEVRTATVEAGIAGKQGVAEVLDYRGIDVLSAYKPIEFHGVKWVVLGEIDSAEVFEDAVDTRNLIALVGLIALIIAAVIGVLGARSLTRPLSGLTDTMRQMADGSYEIQVPATDRADELGDMAKAAEFFRGKLIEGRDLAARQAAEQERQIERGRKMEAAVTDFDKLISEVVNAVSSAANELQSTAQSLSATAEET
ncbi:MAG: HAMP domain-containing protein, partial [Rhodospirillaceae bacterium]|nr:HAMP domain-containing protein [Rhodospirillaceae bacterium]